ncbi:MAG: CHAT domain-containing protein [Thermoanaerobaculia bacterium]
MSCALALLTACGQPQRATRGGQETTRVLRFRPGQGRLAGLSWADAKSPQNLRAIAPRLRHKASEIFADPLERSAAGPLRAAAVLDLLSGKADPALRELTRVAELAPGNALVWSDLAAVRLQRGTAFSDPYEFLRALGAANRAVRLDPGRLDGHFNRALALQRLAFYDRAREEWRLYLRSERDPSWLLAARTHAAELERHQRPPTAENRSRAFETAVANGDASQEREIVARSPQLFRERAEEKFLPAWADAQARGDEAEARRQWTMGRIVGEALAAKSGDWMTLDSLSSIERARQRQPDNVRELADAIQSYGRGVALSRQGDFAKAMPILQATHEKLTRAQSPLAGWALYWTAVGHYQHSKYAQALKALLPLTQDRIRDRYPALHGRALSLMGVIQIIQGDPTASGASYQAALIDFQRLGEDGNTARTSALQALNLEYLGRRVEAWRQLYPALLDTETLDSPSARQLINLVAAWLALQEGEREIALWFQDELIRNSLDLKMAQGIVEALRGHSEILVALGERAGAEKDLDLAKFHLADVSDPASRDVLEGDLKLAEAKLAGSPQEALDLLDDVVRIFRSSEYHYRLGQALYARATALNALGRSAEAERDLATAIGEFEQQRERIDLLEQRISYFDQTREILDAMVQLQLERRHRPAAAFSYSERARARVLLDWLLAQPAGQSSPVLQRQVEPATVDPESLQRRLPAGTTFLEYWALPRSLVIWVLRRDGFQVQSVPIDRQTLEGLVQRLSDELAQGRKAAFLRTSAQLYDLLIRPVARYLQPGGRLVAIPDGALHALPFVMLRDRQTAKFLIEDHICSVAPSVRLLLASLARDTKLATPQPPRALVISDPAFSYQLFPTLVRLKSSLTEKTVVRSFRGSLVLKDQAATRRAFLDSAGQFEIVHFGGHSLVNPEYPLLSQMVFAAVPGNPGVLYSGDILRASLPKTRLAVLASCSTAAGKISRTEGIESLARPFLATGVPAVIASLWDVDDELTAKLFSRFYSHLAESFDPALALHESQIEALAAGGAEADPRSWGAFELIGGNSAPQ